MIAWLRSIDERLFSPPHKFNTILAIIALQLGLTFEEESGDQLEHDAEPPSGRSRTQPENPA